MSVPVLRKLSVTLGGIECIDPVNPGDPGTVSWDMVSQPGGFSSGDWQLRLFYAGAPILAIQADPTGVRIPMPLFLGGGSTTGQTEVQTLAASGRLAYLPDKSGTFAFLDDVAFPPDYISGMQISTTATTITVSAGSFMSDDGNLVEHPGGVISSSRAANTLYHLYATAAGGLLRVSTAPAAPFFASARGYASGEGRWIGCVRTGDGVLTSNYIQQQSDWGNNQVRVSFLQNTGAAPLALVVASALTGVQDASGAAITYGPTCNFFTVRIMNGAGSAAAVRYYAWTGTAFVILSNLPNPATLVACDVPVDNTPKMQWDNTAAGGNATINLLGYGYSR